MGIKRKDRLQAAGLILISLQFLFVTSIDAQQRSRTMTRERENLLHFSKARAASWELDKQKADSLAKAQDLPVRYQDKNGRNVELQRLGYRNRPYYYATDNVDAARIISVDQVWTGEGGVPFLSGEGIEIGQWDGGAVRGTHREFMVGGSSRILMRETELSLSNHSTHVAGTMIAAGIDEDARGMASGATLFSWDYSNDIAEMAIGASEGIVVSNHSYGPLCGWYFNTTSESWYWYGDPQISEEEDYQFGFYDEESADLDYIAWCAPHYLIVKSAGNDRNDAPDIQPIEHLVWDEKWLQVTTVRDNDGGEDGFDCLTPMAVSKNILTVGAVDDNRIIASFSSFGPTDDGRIKPDVLANGTGVYSSIASSDVSYDSMNGTSMSAASATGSISLLHQLHQELQPGEVLLSSTMKGMLIHTADECGPAPGPDYQHGWGILNIKEAADLMQLNYGNGGSNIYEGNLSEGESVLIPVEVSSPSSGLKITLCWTDPPGEASEPALNPADSKLINDLNLELIQAGITQSVLPWRLDPENPESPAIRGVNHLDNVEQLFLEDPAPGNYQVKISYSGSLLGGEQSYSLIITGISTPEGIMPPSSLLYNTGPLSVSLKWTSPEQGLPAFYRIYRNDLLLAETTDTCFSDLEVITNVVYEYYTTAVYEREGEEFESLGTNRVMAIPRTLRTLPLVIDFEVGSLDMIIKDNPVGWRWGDSESLSSYYLRFEENTTHFIAADSYTNGKIAHVNDVASTLPLKLGGSRDVILSFDYMLVTEIYGAIDELHVMYKLQEETEWHELFQLPRSHSWTHYSLPLPDELCMDGIQLGFYYDDFYLWGMGAGLDNISIVGEAGRSVDLAITSMISPVSACTPSDAEPVSITILNAGDEDALPGDLFNLHLEVSPGIQIEEQLVLTEALHGGDILTYQMGSKVDLSETGTYSFSFLLTSELDVNVLNNTLKSVVEITEVPVVSIWNRDLLFCEDEGPVLIQCSPEGGTLTGTGVYGFYFDPGTAGPGVHLLTYSITVPGGCHGTASAEVEVMAQPKPVILNEDLLFCEDEDPVLIQCTPVGGTLTGTGVLGLYFDPGAAGEGTHVLTYRFTDPNGCQGTASIEVEVVAQPDPIILNENPRYCEDESGVLIRCSPEGGTLSGKGVSGNNFYPREANIGSNPVSYVVMYKGGCAATTSKDFFVNENPLVDLGTDRQIEMDDTIELLPTGNGVSYLWFDASTEDSKLIIANNLGIGDYDIWVEAFSPENCSAVDSILLTIGEINSIKTDENTFHPFVRPNPFTKGFYLEINKNEVVKKISIYDLTGRIFSNGIPSGFPYFQVPDLRAGSYILKVETKEHIYLIRVVKI